MYSSNPSNPAIQQSRNMATTTLTMAPRHTGARDQLQRKQLHSRTHANTNGRKAFYDVSDALQETGNRGRAFDTIVLETSAETGEFERYVVFEQNVAAERIHVDATIILYDTHTEKFYSDGAYHKHTFCPSADGFVSVSEEHIANEKFKFYKQRV